MVGIPLHKKCTTDSGTINPTVDPYNPDNWEEGTYEEDWIRYDPPPPNPAGLVPLAQPIQADELCLPKYILLPKIIKPRLQASLPASVTGVLPCPLGKAPTRLAICTHQWYDECDINDPCLDALYEEAKQLKAQHCPTYHVSMHYKPQAPAVQARHLSYRGRTPP